MVFRQFATRATGSLAYLVADADAAEAVAVDPLPEDHAIVLALLDERNFRLRWVLRTHTHAGCDDGMAALCRRTGATLAAATARLNPLADGDTLAFGAELLRVIATPGHTPDSLSFLWRDRLFSGDALEIGGCERSTAGETDPGRLYESVTRRLFALPGETLVFPGHAFHERRVSTIAEERARNRSFARMSRDAFIAAWRRDHGSA